MLPDQFVASAASREWKVPPVDQVTLDVIAQYDYSVWLDWAKDLPDLSESPSPPDPGVFERFCLVVRRPDTDDLDERTYDAFEDSVWYKLLEEYGRPLHSVIEFKPDVNGIILEEYIDNNIDWIAVKHRDSAIALVLDGLCRYGLMDRVKLICNEPDPDDWQRDRDVTVWPASRRSFLGQGEE
jgi:hypothetical protein